MIQEELPKFGFKEFYAEFKGGSSNIVIIKGVDPSTGKEVEQKYPFPRVGKSFESLRNFRSAFRNFIRQELPDRNCYAPMDHRVRQPGRYIAHINHDVPKKQLATPTPLLRLIGELKPELHEVLAPPTIPEEPPKLNKAGEPVSSRMILATFIVDINDLSSVVDVCEGTAKFHRYRPCPLRLLDEKPVEKPAPVLAVVPAVPAPDPVPTSPVQTLAQLLSISANPLNFSLQDRIVQRMRTDRKREWSAKDFMDLSKSSNSLNASLSVLNSYKRIKKVAFGKYKAK